LALLDLQVLLALKELLVQLLVLLDLQVLLVMMDLLVPLEHQGQMGQDLI
jgi:hypothetical protein